MHEAAHCEPVPIQRQPTQPAPRQQQTGAATEQSGAEIDFWARLEEYEDGRIAHEADHLFDTSFDWAA